MKCMVQMPVPPSANAARISQPTRRRRRWYGGPRTAQVRPSTEPSTDSAYASTGVIQP